MDFATYSFTLLTTSPGITAAATFPLDHLAFQGHFPGNPILPAFMQVQLALDTLETVGRPHTLRQLTVAKFLKPVAPNTAITITITALADGFTYAAELETSGGLASSFTLQVG